MSNTGSNDTSINLQIRASLVGDDKLTESLGNIVHATTEARKSLKSTFKGMCVFVGLS